MLCGSPIQQMSLVVHDSQQIDRGTLPACCQNAATDLCVAPCLLDLLPPTDCLLFPTYLLAMALVLPSSEASTGLSTRTVVLIMTVRHHHAYYFALPAYHVNMVPFSIIHIYYRHAPMPWR